MSRVLLWLLIGLLAWWGIRRLRQPDDAQPDPRPTPPKPQSTEAKPAPSATTLVPCAHCGAHLPASESLSHPSPEGVVLHYCSEAHRKRGPRPTR